MKKIYPIDVEIGQNWLCKDTDLIKTITEVKDDSVVLYDRMYEGYSEISIDKLMRHWVWVDEDAYDLLFNEVDCALCHLISAIEASNIKHPDLSCAEKHINRIKDMAEQILGLKATDRTQATEMIKRVYNHEKA